MTVSKLVEQVKASSSVWIKTQELTCRGFAWQAGYGAFSLGQSQLPALTKYIDNQAAHHHKRTFKEEFVDLLAKYGVECNERYLWD